ncbi:MULTISPECIES: prepilin peptidase [Streptomyces]|uniref:A24 family peptidase n=3 Tax=Streptomyces TaxID=1883 RepID=A0ABD5JB82_9ACTN|nr:MULTISPECIES: A24 family peptidase [Streptomyces]MEE4585310.1 A24 family peptidase [Streptomyces sp. DSM 41602]WTA83743.1 A24 family peptidase [Streptomyces antimycoticus]KUL50444.1 peptidase A24 [Streptomyces violaceusniger]RSS45998.1 prepilin peptidase [Streptomyces sp. WAC05858]WTB05821.1 A24 family peptidase [Streptomyces antimycoticus]
MQPLLIVLAAAYGAAAGLLVPRPLYRLAVDPEEPWRGACPRGHVLTGPARGWLGPARCAGCRGGERDYGAGPVPAVLTALVCAGLAAAVGARPELAVWLLLVPLGVLLTGVDLAVNRLPDVLTLPMAGGAAVLLGAAALLPHSAGSWPRALLGGAVLGGAYLVLFLISPSGMGFGDVKLALTLGVALGWYGWDVLFVGAFAGLLLGSCCAVVLVLTRRAGRRTAMAFGPFMILGAGAGLILGALGAG